MAFIGGDTIILTSLFKNGTSPVDVTSKVVKVYDPYDNLLTTRVDNQITRTGVGAYEVPYTLPNKYTKVIQEWSAVYEGYPTVEREDIAVIWSNTEVI